MDGIVRSRSARTRCRGCSAVELMVALGVLLVAVAGAFGAQLVTLRLVDTSRETQVALGDLRACMERLLTVPSTELPVDGSDFADGEPVQAFEGLHLEGERIVASYPGFVEGQPVPEPLPVVLTVTWTDSSGGERSLTLRSLKGR